MFQWYGVDVWQGGSSIGLQVSKLTEPLDILSLMDFPTPLAMDERLPVRFLGFVNDRFI